VRPECFCGKSLLALRLSAVIPNPVPALLPETAVSDLLLPSPMADAGKLRSRPGPQARIQNQSPALRFRARQRLNRRYFSSRHSEQSEESLFVLRPGPKNPTFQKPKRGAPSRPLGRAETCPTRPIGTFCGEGCGARKDWLMVLLKRTIAPGFVNVRRVR
jgi:hypothetical protein